MLRFDELFLLFLQSYFLSGAKVLYIARIERKYVILAYLGLKCTIYHICTYMNTCVKQNDIWLEIKLKMPIIQVESQSRK